MNRRFFLKSLSVLSFYYSAFARPSYPIDKEISVKEYGARGDGNSDDSQSFLNAFTSHYSNIYIPSGTYKINSPLELNLNKHLHIRCDKKVIIKLGDNVRKTMFIFFGDNNHDFSWDGGEIDGNWEGQGKEGKNVHGRFNDISHGMVLAHWQNCRISNIYLHDFMGHHVNHAGNFNFHATNVKIKSHPSINFPDGGARGDGITGASVNNYFDNISGFCTDDLIALFAGIKWLPKVVDSDNTIIRNIYINNVYTNELFDSGHTYYTWHAITIGVKTNFNIDNILISNVTASCKDRGIAIITDVNTNDFFGSIKNLSLSNVKCDVVGFDKDGYEHSPIILGEPTYKKSDGLDSGKTIKIKAVNLSGISCDNSYNMKACIAMGNITANAIAIDNVSISKLDKSTPKPLISVSGPAYIDNITFDTIADAGDTPRIIKFNIPNDYPIKIIKKPNVSKELYGGKMEIMFENSSVNKLIYSKDDFISTK